jgi:hypothetical protein
MSGWGRCSETTERCVGDGGAARGDRGDTEAARGCAGEGGAEGVEAARGVGEGGAEGVEAARGSAGVGGAGRAALGGEVDEPDT